MGKGGRGEVGRESSEGGTLTLVGVLMGASVSRSRGGNSLPSSFSCSYTSTTACSSGLPRKASAHDWIRPRMRSRTSGGGEFCGEMGERWMSR